MHGGSGSAWNWQQSWIGSTNVTSNITLYPNGLSYAQPHPLPSVVKSPSVKLDDREWLDAQIVEVCELAEAA